MQRMQKALYSWKIVRTPSPLAMISNRLLWLDLKLTAFLYVNSIYSGHCILPPSSPPLPPQSTSHSPWASFIYFFQFGDYVFFNASLKGISPLDGFKQFLSNSSRSTKINFAQGCELWSNDDSGFTAAVHAAQSSDVAIVMVRFTRVFP